MSTQSGPPSITVTRSDHERLTELAAAAIRHMPAVGAFLADELDRARIVDAADLAPTVVTMGSCVEFQDDQTGQRRTVTLVYPGEQNIAEGKISILTPVGAALLGLSQGQSVEWETRGGEVKSLTVIRLLYQPEAQAEPARTD